MSTTSNPLRAGSPNPEYEAVASEGDVEAQAAAEAEEDDAFVSIRVLETKSSTTKTVRIRKDATVAALSLAIEDAFGVAPEVQRLIASGRQMKAEDLIRSYRVDTIHLVHRVAPPARTEGVPGLLEEGGHHHHHHHHHHHQSLDGEMSHASLSPDFVAALRLRQGSGGHPGGDDDDDAHDRLDLVHQSLEPVAQSAARVRMFSTLLVLYASLNCLGALVDLSATDDESSQRALVALGVNVLGVWVGFAGMKASRTLDPDAAAKYDRALRCFAVLDLVTETLTSLEDVDDMDRSWTGNGGAEADDAAASPHYYANATRDYDDDGDSVSALRTKSRQAAIFSAFVALIIWAAIWLTCVQYSAQFRAQLRMQMIRPQEDEAAAPPPRRAPSRAHDDDDDDDDDAQEPPTATATVVVEPPQATVQAFPLHDV